MKLKDKVVVNVNRNASVGYVSGIRLTTYISQWPKPADGSVESTLEYLIDFKNGDVKWFDESCVTKGDQ